jgi:hypothetical protein
MKNPTCALAFLAALASAAPAFAQSSGGAQDTPWSDLAVGDRVEVTFRSGGTISGKLIAPISKSSAVDYSKETSLTLDVSEAGVDGTLSASKKDIKRIRKLGVEQKPISDIIGSRSKKVEDPKPEKPPAPPPAPAPETAPKPETDEERQARLKKEEEEKLKAEAMAFYAKFQPPYWGPERHTMNLQKKARGRPGAPRKTNSRRTTTGSGRKARTFRPSPSPRKTERHFFARHSGSRRARWRPSRG